MRRIVIFPDFFHEGYFFWARVYEWLLGIAGRAPGEEEYEDDFDVS